MFAELEQWVAEDNLRALRALRIGKAVIDSGVNVRIAGDDSERNIAKTLAPILKDQERLARDCERAKLDRDNAIVERERAKLEREQALVDIERLKHEHATSDSSRELADLRAVNTELQSQLDETRKLVKQSTNSAKGQIGQSSIEGIVRTIWPAADIQNTSGAAGMSDMHVVTKRGRLVIECKNKEIITADDVRKSIRDIDVIRQAHPDFVGYMFTSIRCTSIPTKGSIYFEFVGNIPVAWVGVDGDLRGIATTMVYLAALIDGVRESRELEFVDEGALYDDVRKHVTSITRQQKIITAMRDQMASLQVLVDESVLRFAPMLEIVADESLCCPKCNKKYVSKHYLAKHVEKCKAVR